MRCDSLFGASRTFTMIERINSKSRSASWSGPWPMKKRSGYYKLGFGFVRANSYYEPNGRRGDWYGAFTGVPAA